MSSFLFWCLKDFLKEELQGKVKGTIPKTELMLLYSILDGFTIVTVFLLNIVLCIGAYEEKFFELAGGMYGAIVIFSYYFLSFFIECVSGALASKCLSRKKLYLSTYCISAHFAFSVMNVLFYIVVVIMYYPEFYQGWLAYVIVFFNVITAVPKLWYNISLYFCTTKIAKISAESFRERHDEKLHDEKLQDEKI